ncbi:MAG: hypothetical protein ACI9OJ_003983 [Myxococcota bacterium]|jgi:hypothetical protein
MQSRFGFIPIALVLLGCDVDGSASLDASPDPTTCDEFRSVECVYLEPPQPLACNPGALSADWTDRAIAEVNRIRGFAELAPVAYDASFESATASCALITAVNQTPAASPPDDSLCYTPEGAAACGQSNVTLFSFSIDSDDPSRVIPLLFTPEVIVRRWLMDLSGDPNLGHRRWLLDPFLKRTAFSAVHTAAFNGTVVNAKQAVSLLVVEPVNEPAGALERDFVAYPIGNFPASLVDHEHYLSFSLLADRAQRAGNFNVNLDDVLITVTGPDGTMDIVDQAADNTGSGIPNHVRWLVDGLEKDTEYIVVVEGVEATQLPARYEYTFKLDSSL